MGFIWVDDKDNDERFEAYMEETTKALTKAKDDLWLEVKELKKKLKEFDGITVDSYNKIKNELELLKKKAGNDDSELATQVRVLSEQLKTIEENSKKQIELLDNENKKLLVDDEINKALIGVNVKKSMMKAARRIIKADVSVIEEGEGANRKRKAVIGDKSIEDYVKIWSETDEGKNFIAAKNNIGGNSHGNNQNPNYASEVETYFDPKSKNYNRTKQAQVKKVNPELYANYMKKYKN